MLLPEFCGFCFDKICISFRWKILIEFNHHATQNMFFIICWLWTDSYCRLKLLVRYWTMLWSHFQFISAPLVEFNQANSEFYSTKCRVYSLEPLLIYCDWIQSRQFPIKWEQLYTDGENLKGDWKMALTWHHWKSVKFIWTGFQRHWTSESPISNIRYWGLSQCDYSLLSEKHSVLLQSYACPFMFGSHALQQQ